MSIWSGRSRVVPVRDLERERAASKPGDVKTWTMSPEELERYRSMPADGKKRNEEAKHMSAQTTAPSKIDFLKEIAAGKSISKLERTWGMKAGSLHYWVGKWGLKGIKPDRAQQLLDEMQLDGEKAEEPTPLEPSIEEAKKLLKEKDTEIERLRAHLMKLKSANTDAVLSVGKAGEKHQIEVKQLRAEIEENKRTIAELWEKLNSFKKSEQALQQQLAEREQEIMALQEGAQTWEERVREYERQLVERDQAIAELTEEREALLATVENAAEEAVDQVPVQGPIGGIETINYLKAILTPQEFQGYCKGISIEVIAQSNIKGGTERLRKTAEYLSYAVGGGRG